MRLQQSPVGRKTSFQDRHVDRVTKETRGGGPGAGVTTYTYDAMSQVKNRSSVTGYDGAGKPINSVTDYAYDPLGRLTSRSSSDSGPTSYAYDAQGNLRTVTAPGGRVTTYLYDLRGLLTGIQEQPTPSCSGGALTQFVYDQNGTRTSSTNPAGATTTYLLDGHDRVTGSVSPPGAYTSASPDTGGRVPTTKVMDRDAQGNPVSIYRWSEQQYDAAGRIIKEIRKLFASPIPVSGPPASTTDSIVETRYDAAGRVTDTIDPLGRITHTDYDEAGRPFRVTDPAGNQTVAEYDAAGRTSKTTGRELRPDGAFDDFATSYTYDDQGRETCSVIARPRRRRARPSGWRSSLCSGSEGPALRPRKRARAPARGGLRPIARSGNQTALRSEERRHGRASSCCTRI